jgi:hypothetical protein
MVPRDIRQTLVFAIVVAGWLVLGGVAWLAVLLLGWAGLAWPESAC